MSRRSASKGRTVGQLARFLRRNTKGPWDDDTGYAVSVQHALGHFTAYSKTHPKLRGSKLSRINFDALRALREMLGQPGGPDHVGN